VEKTLAEERRLALALRAAQMYYLQDQTMETIARELAMSRSSVSRLLSHARDAGIVDIRVHSPLDRGSLLERKIGGRFHVTAHVVPVPQVITDVERLDRVATTAGRLVSEFIHSNDVIGVAWGSTMNAVGRHLVRKDVQNTVTVQMNGAGNMHTTGIGYANKILQQFGDAFGSQIQEFAVPAFFDHPQTREALWGERSVRRVLEIQSRMDVAIFGLGSPFAEVPSHVYIGGYLEKQDFRSLTADRAIGDVATVFFRPDGTSQDIALNARASGPELARLARVARRVCVVSGVQKLPSLRGALAAGLITDLILDEGLATELLAST
jgi:DNA-binding transcriptional regulator LsrR (DeoR family)